MKSLARLKQRIISQARMNVLVRRTPGFYGRAMRELAAPPAENDQKRKLARILRLASALPAYASVGSTRLSDYPLLSKDQIRACPADYLRQTWLPKSVAKTSGTTGVPLGVSRSLNAVVFEQAVIDWLCAKAGIDLARARSAVLRGLDLKAPDDRAPPFWRQAGNSLLFSSNHLDRSTVRHFVSALNAFRPDVVLAYPSVAENLIRLMQREGLDFRCALVVTSSERLTPEARAKISDAFDARVFDYYGQAERVACAYSLEPGAYWFVPHYAYVELLDGDDQRGHEIVGTPLHNVSQILVRYRTGDHIVTAAHDPQHLRDVAAGRLPFEAVLGRTTDNVLLARRGGILVGIDHIPRGLDDLGRFQVIQTAPDQALILVQASGEVPADAERRIMANARTKLPAGFDVRIAFVDDLRRTPSGKTPYVIREVSEADLG